MTSQKRKFAATTLLFWFLEVPQSYGLQLNPTFAGTTRVPTSWPIHKRPTCRLRSQIASFAATTNAAAWTSDLTQDDENTQPIAYTWDEQFEELQKFMAEYGHCNFPQNPSKELMQEYPMLERFCKDQRREYKLFLVNTRRYERMSVAGFDRKVRFRRLEELGFEFNVLLAKWYDSYYVLQAYFRENGHTRVTKSENEILTKWIYTQRNRRNGVKGKTELSDFQIKLLNDIGFAWESQLYDAMWNEKYEELVEFRNKHGNFMMMEANSTLYNWVNSQRQRRAGKGSYSAFSDEQIRLLDEIEFPWEPDRFDAKWFAMYNELKQFHKEHGHWEPDPAKHKRLFYWLHDQRKKHRKGALSTEQLQLMNEIGFSWESNVKKWPMMLAKLTEYSHKYGSLQVSQKDEPELYEWMDNNRQRYHDIRQKSTLSDEQVEQLEDLHFCWSLDWRDRVWHKKYTEAVEYFKGYGHIRVTSEENPSLYNWIQTQEKRYKGAEGQKPLSEEELGMLEQIDFLFLEGRPCMAWNAMFVKVTKYREENDDRLPTSHKDDPELSRWLRHQRYRYRSAFGYAPLSDEQKEMLLSIGLSMYPNGKRTGQWYERYDELVEFWKENGHFVVDRFENPTLYGWILTQRKGYNGLSFDSSPLSKLQVYLLEQIGFSWTSNRNELEWQQCYEELVEFLEAEGHFPKKYENPRLYRWANTQRRKYKGTFVSHLSEKQILQLEKIGFQWSLRD